MNAIVVLRSRQVRGVKSMLIRENPISEEKSALIDALIKSGHSLSYIAEQCNVYKTTVIGRRNHLEEERRQLEALKSSGHLKNPIQCLN